MATEAAPDGLVSNRRQYRFGQVERRCAKLLLVPTLVVAAFGIWRTLPSGLLGRDRIDGVVCSSETGGPVANASVAVLDRRRTPVSLPGFPTDSLGYFVAQVGWWSTGPATLAIGAAGDDRRYRLATPSADPRAAAHTAPPGISTMRHSWYVSCSGGKNGS